VFVDAKRIIVGLAECVSEAAGMDEIILEADV
jgi:hypothetical protein